MGYLHLPLFWLPALVALVLLIVLRRAGSLRGAGAVVAWIWFLGALFLQARGHSIASWSIGFVMQTALALFAAIRLRSGD